MLFLAGTCSFSPCLLCENFSSIAHWSGEIWRNTIDIIVFWMRQFSRYLFSITFFNWGNFLKSEQQNAVVWKDERNWHINFSSMRPFGRQLSFLDFFQTNSWFPAGVVILVVSSASPIMVSNFFWNTWSRLTNQKMLLSSYLPLCQNFSFFSKKPLNFGPKGRFQQVTL